MSRALDFLFRAQNNDGGWGYKLGGMSYVEPTAAVLLALTQDAPNDPAVHRARLWLKQTQHADGGWGIAASDAESGWMTAWAVWALASSDAESAKRGADWLLGQSGIRVNDPQQVAGVEKVLHINPSITGWAWQPGDAAWIFPSALALLALHAMGVNDHPRVREGLVYLQDRAIASGGWNIGNPFMVTGEMPPTVENTVIALKALDAFGLTSDKTQLGRTWLAQPFTATAFEWAWRVWLDSAEDVEELNKFQRDDGSWDGNPFTTAIAVLARGGT